MFGWFSKPKQTLPDINRSIIDHRFIDLVNQFADKKLGLCLVGGGSKGRWQIGFLFRMFELGLLSQVKVIAGTSVGGLNALLTAKYRNSFKDAVDVWRNISSNSDVYSGSLPGDAFSIFTSLITGKLTGKSVLGVKPLTDLVIKHFKDYESNFPVYVITTDRTTLQKNVLSSLTKSFIDMALSTCAVPGAFPAYQDTFLDGGCSSNAPIIELEEIGKVDKVIILYCDPDPSKKQASSEAPSVLNNLLSAVNALYAVQEERTYKEIELMTENRKLKGLPSIDYAHFYPSVDTGQLLIFDKVELLQQGYDDAVKYLTIDKLKELLA